MNIFQLLKKNLSKLIILTCAFLLLIKWWKLSELQTFTLEKLLQLVRKVSDMPPFTLAGSFTVSLKGLFIDPILLYSVSHETRKSSFLKVIRQSIYLNVLFFNQKP